MTILINVDGFPFTVSFGGGIDIERLPSGDVALRGGWPVTVKLDEIALARDRELLEDVRRRMAEFDWRLAQDFDELLERKVYEYNHDINECCKHVR